MTTDIRAKVYCNLGKVVSGDFGDDYLQGNGLISTRGTVVLDGIYKPAVGDKVEFAYYKNNRIAKLPRTLRVLSSFADPFRRITTVEVGCKFTYFGNRKPPIINPKSNEENDIDCEIYNTAIIPISAAYVFQKCLDVLELQSDPIPLTNKFSLEEFDLSPGYIQVMGDLLSSEGYFCYLDESETVKIRSFNETVNTGPLLTGSDLIDLSPIGVGDLPGDAVIVRFDFLTLKEPGELSSEELAKRNWEYEANINTGGKITIYSWGSLLEGTVFSGGAPTRYTVISGAEVVKTEYDDYTITETFTTYDAWDRISKREVITKRPFVAVNPSYVQQVLDYSYVYPHLFKPTLFRPGFLNIPVLDYSQDPPLRYISGPDQPTEEKVIEYYYYKYNPDSSLNSCYIPSSDSQEYDSLVRKETLKYESAAKIYGTVWTHGYFKFSIGYVTEEVEKRFKLLRMPDRTADYLTEKTIEYYDKQPSDMTSVSQNLLKTVFDRRSGIFENVMTKQVTERYIANFYTPEGQKYIANATAASWDTYYAEYAFETAIAMDLAFESIQFAQFVGRNVSLEARPPRSSLVNRANSKPDVTEGVAEIEWITGSTESNAVIELQMPYSPDDEITYSPEAGYGLIKSDAKAKAQNYGKTQNALLLGNRNGVSIQISADLMPPRPFDPIYIEAEGLKGQYRINGTSYTFDSNGIVASTDAMFWGGIA
jgi:hypothetical protein